MKLIRYFFEFLVVAVLLAIFKILGFKLASNLGKFIGQRVGPFFRSKDKIKSNIKKALPNNEEKNIELIVQKMWGNYGRILSEYMFIKNFRNSRHKKFLTIDGQEILDELKIQGENQE